MKRLALLVLPLLAGCGVSTLSEEEPKSTRNECSADAECGSGTCSGGMCRATEGSFGSVLFEVTPPASLAKIGGVQHFKRIDGLSLSGGGQDIALARLAHLEGTITPIWPNRDLCAFEDNKASVSVIVTPSDRLLGLGPQKYEADAIFSGGSFKFTLNVPAADYDIYVQPKNQSVDCEFAPQLYRRNTVPEDKGTVAVPLNLPAPSTLDLRVAWPPGDARIEDWRVDMIDPDTRRALSNEIKLTSDARDGDAYEVTLLYSPVIGTGAPAGRELVRLRPREGVAAPTILLERSGLELSVPGQAEIDQLMSLPQIVGCEGLVVLAGSPEYVGRAVVTISAVRLDQAVGVTTEYSQTVTADDDGKFFVQLFPGMYRVVAVPPSGSGYATGVGQWEVGEANIQNGRSIEVAHLVTLNGNVVTTGGAPVLGATVSAVASPASLVADPIVNRVPIIPRPGSAKVGENGAFAFGADPGSYDLSVRPVEGTGFAWFVRPSVHVDGLNPAIDLGALQMPLPLAYSGAVTAEVDGSTQTIPGALIRAYVYVTSDQTYTIDAMRAASVLQIGEARAGEGGRFELLLPAQFDRPAPAP